MSVADIQRLVAASYGLTVAELKGASQQHRIAHPRQLAMWLARRHTGRSAAEIGRLFGDRDHTTVLHAFRAVDARLERSETFKADVALLDERLAGGPAADLADEAARRAIAMARKVAEEAMEKRLEAIAHGLARAASGDPAGLLARIAEIAGVGAEFDT